MDPKGLFRLGTRRVWSPEPRVPSSSTSRRDRSVNWKDSTKRLFGLSLLVEGS